MKLDTVKLDLLKTDVNCVKHHNKKNIQSIKRSLIKFKQYSPLVVNKNNFEILKGVGTFMAMKQLGYKQCQVVFVDLNQIQQNQLIVLDNRTSQLSDLDYKSIQKLFYDLQKDQVLFTGFSEKQLQNIMNQPTDLYKQDQTQKVNLVKIKCPYCGTQFSEK